MKTICVLTSLLLEAWIVSGNSRFSLPLDGIWKFRISPAQHPMAGFSEQWWARDFSLDPQSIDMPVPSSYNDLSTDSSVRDFVGWAWYQRAFEVPYSMSNQHATLHFGSVQYYTRVWINQDVVGDHEGGHIPFELDITKSLSNLSGNQIMVTVAVNNTLNHHTIPQGSLTFNTDKDNFTYVMYSHDFDYFDYAGLNGKVRVDWKPSSHISDIGILDTSVSSGGDNKEATVVWIAEFTLGKNHLMSHYTMRDPLGQLVVSEELGEVNSPQITVRTTIPNPKLWWPRATFPGVTPGLMYTIELVLRDGTTQVDVLKCNFGIRVVEVRGSSILLNGLPLYLKGFGMHQDAEIRGRGFDAVQLVRDINLLKWTGANSIRTSHYPYPVDFVEMADRYGIMVILESPACSLSGFSGVLLQRHKQVLKEMWTVFRNHPSVIMWSLANEPQSNDNNSTDYFQNLTQYVKSLDTNRLVTFVTSQQIENEKAVQAVDVICVNRYQGWYSRSGRTDLIKHFVVEEMRGWREKYGKPVILSEYGAEALAGLHSLPSTMWTENYQIDTFHAHFEAFDALRHESVLSGEMVWNFADFKVPQEYFRAEFCDKGVFTRNRQPKAGAYTIKERYDNLLLENIVIKIQR